MKTDKLYYGVAYYDEYLPYDRIETDFQMMKDAGMNVIRIAESTWSTWEPREGEFDFTHLHRMLDCAKKYGLSVIVGTPTYAIPSWLNNKADDILAVWHSGVNLYGPRQNMDITHPLYLHHCEIIIRKLMEEVKDEPHVIGFQLDNETKHYDTCGPRAQQMFVERLKKQWPNIEDFNREFGLSYWSNSIADWEDFPDIRATINQSLSAEYSKFQRSLVTEFLAWQAKIVAEYKRPDQFITQNFDFGWSDHSIGLQPEVNQFEACKCMDVAGADIYHYAGADLTGDEITLCGNINRGLLRDNYLILETLAQGNPGWLPYPKQLRLQAYSHIANGSNSVMYWHWHSIHNAIESYWKGVLSHDLMPNATYKECCTIGNEWKQYGNVLKNLKKENKVAIVADNDSLTALTNFPTATAAQHSYNTVLGWLGHALFHMNIEYDIIPARGELLSEYDVVMLPAYYCAPEVFLKAVEAYVAEGGNIVVTYKSCFADEHLKIYHDVQPHILSKVLGIHYDQFTYPKNVKGSYKGRTFDVREWMELLYTDTARSIAKYDHKAWGEYSVACTNTYKKGHSLYLGALFDEEILKEMLQDFFREIHLEEPQKLMTDATYPLAVKQGINEDGKHVLYYLNYSDTEQTTTNLYAGALELFSGRTLAEKEVLTVGPWDLLIVLV